MARFQLYVLKSLAELLGTVFKPHGKCPRCGKGLFGGRLVVRVGKYGKFLGCSNYPKCKYTRNIL